jgi:hypothetical protein
MGFKSNTIPSIVNDGLFFLCRWDCIQFVLCGDLKGAIFFKKAFTPYWNSFILQVGIEVFITAFYDKCPLIIRLKYVMEEKKLKRIVNKEGLFSYYNSPQFIPHILENFTIIG